MRSFEHYVIMTIMELSTYDFSSCDHFHRVLERLKCQVVFPKCILVLIKFRLYKVSTCMGTTTKCM